MKMSKEDFKKELENHNLDVNGFLDLRDAWQSLSAKEKIYLLKEEIENNDGKK